MYEATHQRALVEDSASPKPGRGGRSAGRLQFFLPGTHWTWYAIEGSTANPDGCGWGENCEHRPLPGYDPAQDDVLFLGYVVGDVPELAYSTLSELTGLRGPLNLRVERDLSFKPCQLSEVKKHRTAAA